MRIAIDGRSFDAKAGGVRRYVRELTTALRVLSPSIGLVAIGGTDVPAGIERRSAPPSLPTNLGWCATGLPLAAARERFDVFHAPAYTAPLWGAAARGDHSRRELRVGRSGRHTWPASVRCGNGSTVGRRIARITYGLAFSKRNHRRVRCVSRPH
jgi:hypothetical protein